MIVLALSVRGLYWNFPCLPVRQAGGTSAKDVVRVIREAADIEPAGTEDTNVDAVTVRRKVPAPKVPF